MNGKKTGEFAWIGTIRDRFASLVPPGAEGIGDDCAVIPAGPEESFVVTTDMLVEEVHFRRDWIRPEELGHKALAVNLSDVAAMGASPVGAFLSIGLPPDIPEAWREGFLDGFYALSERFRVPLLGGDTTASEKLVVSVTALGKARPEEIKRRSGAQAGDLVCVTGHLGDSAAGLRLLKEGERCYTEMEQRLIGKHHRPDPQVEQGVWLGKQSGVHAMMDVSDGIASDLVHILVASGVSAEVEIGSLPVSEPLRATSSRYGWDAEGLAANGGEDYVLLVVVESDKFDKLNKNFNSNFSQRLHPVGTIIPGESRIHWFRNRKPTDVNWKGFSHF